MENETFNRDDHTYLGDGVYAEAINGVIRLRLNAHTDRVVCVLEPEVLAQLIRFAQSKGMKV